MLAYSRELVLIGLAIGKSQKKKKEIKLKH